MRVDGMSGTRKELLRWWVGWVLAMTFVCVAISIRYFATAQLDASMSSMAFRAVMLIAHFAVLCSILLSPVLVLALAWPRPRWVISVAVAMSLLVALVLLIDTQVYLLYRFHINPGVLNLLLGGAARETFVFPVVMYVQAATVAVVVAAGLAALAMFLWRRIRDSRTNPLLVRSIVTLVAVCTVTFHGVHIWADAASHEPIIEQTAVLPIHSAATAKRFLRGSGFVVRPARTPELRGVSDRSELSYPLQPLRCDHSAPAPNIVFIVIDSWRFDAMNATVTPNITGFSHRAVRFDDHQSGGNATRIGIFSLFYSIPGTYWHEMLHEQRRPAFIDELQRRDYDIQVFRSAPIYSPEFDRTVFAHIAIDRIRSDGDNPADWDRDLTDDFVRYLRDRNDGWTKPLFAFLFYDSPHSFQLPAGYPLAFVPSAPNVNYLRLSSKTDAKPLLNRYLNSVHFVDSLVGEVLEAMQSHGLLETTIVVITGDHGQEFNDTGKNFWGHGSNFTRYQTGVPMVLYVPGARPAVVKYRTSHFDVVPTLLRDHMHCRAPLNSFSVGRSLFDSANRHPLLLSEYADFAVLERDRIAVVRESGVGMFTADYTKIDQSLAPETARSVLEQQTRFFKAAGWREALGQTPVATSFTEP